MGTCTKRLACSLRFRGQAPEKKDLVGKKFEDEGKNQTLEYWNDKNSSILSR